MAHDQRSMKNQEQEEEALQSQLNDKVDEVAMYAEAFQRNQKYKNHSKKNNKSWQGKEKLNDSNQKRKKSHTRCFSCKNYRYYQSQCRFEKNENKIVNAKVAQNNFNETETLSMVRNNVEKTKSIAGFQTLVVVTTCERVKICSSKQMKQHVMK